MLNNNDNKGMENGYVVLPLAKYNDLVAKVEEAENVLSNLIRLRESYSNQINIEFDSQRIYDAAKMLYETSSFNTPERELVKIENFRVYSADLTRAAVTEETE